MTARMPLWRAIVITLLIDAARLCFWASSVAHSCQRLAMRAASWIIGRAEHCARASWR